MRDALREPQVRAVVQSIAGGLLVVAALIGLTLAEGSTSRIIVAVVQAVVGAVLIADGIRSYRRARK